jgi:hypothetical protein
MVQAEYEAALSEFLRSEGITRCPTAYVAPTYATVPETDRVALRCHGDALEAARLEKLLGSRKIDTSFDVRKDDDQLRGMPSLSFSKASSPDPAKCMTYVPWRASRRAFVVGLVLPIQLCGLAMVLCRRLPAPHHRRRGAAPSGSPARIFHRRSADDTPSPPVCRCPPKATVKAAMPQSAPNVETSK